MHFQKFRFFKTNLLLNDYFFRQISADQEENASCQLSAHPSRIGVPCHQFQVCFKMKVMFELEKFKLLDFITSRRFHSEKSENIKVGWK